MEHETIQNAGKIREYFIYVPSYYSREEPIPLLMVFHGAAGKVWRFGACTGFNDLSEKHGFISVYPKGLNDHWNDGRETEKFAQHDHEIDDIAFVVALIDELKSTYNIDKNKIFATGISNGGLFSQRLAVEQTHLFAAVASVAAQMAEPLSRSFNPQGPISVMIINGTEDPLVPYSGGELNNFELFPRFSRFIKKPSKGTVISTDANIRLWLEHNKIYNLPVIEKIPDIDNDGVTAERVAWIGRQKEVSVVLYKIIGGGHTWPGGKQYLPEKQIGKTCKDINASKIIWDFFSKIKNHR